MFSVILGRLSVFLLCVYVEALSLPLEPASGLCDEEDKEVLEGNDEEDDEEDDVEGNDEEEEEDEEDEEVDEEEEEEPGL